MLNKPGRREALAAAKKEAGEAHAEKATEIADTVPESRDAVAKARLHRGKRPCSTQQRRVVS